MDKDKVQHDFINNGLRLDILNKLLTEQLEKNSALDLEYLNDLEIFLNVHLDLVKKLKKVPL